MNRQSISFPNESSTLICDLYFDALRLLINLSLNFEESFVRGITFNSDLEYAMIVNQVTVGGL